jgi:hypothetical protein
MELDITRFVRANRDCMSNFSSSIAESGLQNIGQVTWRNATEAMADESSWLTSDLTTLQDYFGEFGAWERNELADMSGQDLNALLVQFIAGDFQEYANAKAEGRKAFKRWNENFGGRIHGSHGHYYYYVGC